jgi:ABC-type multidrug transport system ATPase subunit
MNVIEVQRISKAYGPVQALRELTFTLREGEIFGLIGPDGAGKTSLFRILATLLLPDSGAASIRLPGGGGPLDLVRDYRQIRQRIGYMPGRFSLYTDLTVEENLSFFASVFGSSIRENYALIAPIYQQIEPFKKRRAGALSGGMKQKLALCCALIHRPGLLLLDEPGTGVDPVSRKEFWDMLRNLRADGLPILVSTPYMDEAEWCDRVALIQQGSILALDTPEGIRQRFQQPLFAVRSDHMYRLIRDLREMPGVADCYAFGAFAHLKLAPDNAPDPAALHSYLQARQHHDIVLQPVAPSIEDCFIEFMKN